MIAKSGENSCVCRPQSRGEHDIVDISCKQLAAFTLLSRVCARPRSNYRSACPNELTSICLFVCDYESRGCLSWFSPPRHGSIAILSSSTANPTVIRVKVSRLYRADTKRTASACCACAMRDCHTRHATLRFSGSPRVGPETVADLECRVVGAGVCERRVVGFLWHWLAWPFLGDLEGRRQEEPGM